MPEAAVARVVRLEPPPADMLTSEFIEDYRACHQRDLKDWPGVSLMFQAGKLTRFELSAPSKVRTFSGVAVGDSESSVLKAHKAKPEINTAEYVDEPAHSLLYWLIPEKRGVRFVTDEHKRVVYIFAGSDSIQYIEGCS
jgi:hypothetical protein